MKDPSDLESKRVLWASALTIAASEIAVLTVRELAVRLLHPAPEFAPLSMAPPIVDTFIATVIAIFVFVQVASSANPVRRWRRVAAVVLIVSFIPDVLIVGSRGRDTNATWPEAGGLMVMHVVVWAICITLLPWLAISKHPRDARAPERPLSIL